MKPRPANRRWGPLAVALVALSSAGPAQAANRLDALLACRALTADAERLACFDRESGTLAVLPASSAALPAPAAARPAEPVLSPEQKFGLDTQQRAARNEAQGQPSGEADTVAAKLTDLHVGADGRYVFTLDNKQVWRQLSPSGDLLLKPGDSIKISRGAIGSFWLAAPSKRGCKVSRLR